MLSLINQTRKEIWVLDAESRGSKSDINEILPALIFAANPYWGKNIRTPKEILIDGKNKAYLRFID